MKLQLKFSPGDHVQHKLFSELHGFVQEIIIGYGRSPTYGVEVFVDDALRVSTFNEHGLCAKGVGNPMELGFGEG